MNVLNAVTVVSRFTSSLGEMLWASLQSTPTVMLGLNRANATTPAPRGKGMRIESPAGGAQFGSTRKFAGNFFEAESVPGMESVLYLTLKNFEPFTKYGISVTLATPMRSPP